MLIGSAYLEDDIVHVATHDSRLFRAGGVGDSGIGCEKKIVIGPAVIIVLSFLFEDTDYGVGNTLLISRLARRGFAAEQLLAGGVAEYHDAAAFGFILLSY